MEMTRRVKVHTGLKCNAKCRFCYYWDSLDAENPPTEEIKAKLRYAKKHGIKDIDFSGGEPTVRPDFPELVSYAKELEFRYICVITNGIRLANKEYFKELISNGLNDVLFSLEGCNAEVHDYLTQVPGSFEKVNKAIQYAKEFGIKLRTNTTVTSINYKYLPELAKYLAKLQSDAVNFILFNDWCSAHKIIQDMACRYSEAAPYLKESIDILDSSVRKVTVRYIPFCFMVGYEKYICNLLQKKYDSDEWDDAIKMRLLSQINIKKMSFRYLTFMLKEFIRYPSAIVRGKFNLREYFHDREVKKMRKEYNYGPGCKDCKYFYICDGLENSYAEAVGVGELKPIGGQKVKDALHYRKLYIIEEKGND
jgi:MoaA/NifB/PqqE/SkfB family radical SAM enzyme